MSELDQFTLRTAGALAAMVMAILVGAALGPCVDEHHSTPVPQASEPPASNYEISDPDDQVFGDPMNPGNPMNAINPASPYHEAIWGDDY